MHEEESIMDNLPALPMWKMLNETIIDMFKNVQRSEENIRMLVNTIVNSDELADALVPRYDSSLSPAHNKITERQYEAFTVWLLGRLYYLLASNKMSRNHELFLQAQLKIIDCITLSLPHIHLKILSEYLNVLKQICCYIDNDIMEREITMTCFCPDNTVIDKSVINLSPQPIKLCGRHSSSNLQKHTVKLITKQLTQHTGLATTTVLESHQLLFHCLESGTYEVHMLIMEYFLHMVNTYVPKYNTNQLINDYVLKFMSFFHQIALRQYMGSSYSKTTNSEHFNKILIDIIRSCIDHNFVEDVVICNKCVEICDYILSHTEPKTDRQEPFFIEISQLLKKIYEYQKIPFSSLTYENFIGNEVPTYILPLLEYQIVEEIKSSITNHNCDHIIVRDVSDIWKKLQGCLWENLEVCVKRTLVTVGLKHKLRIVRNIIKSTRNICLRIKEFCYKKYSKMVNLTFLKLSKFLINCRSIKEKYKLNTFLYLINITDCFEYILSTVELTMTNVTQVEIMIYYLCLPFIGCVNFPLIDQALKSSLQNDLSEEMKLAKQKESLQKLSICLSNCSVKEWRHFSCVQQWIKNIFVYAINDLPDVVGKCLPYLISCWKDEGIFTDVIIPFLRSHVPANGLIICQTLGEASVVRKINYTSEILYYDLYCGHCDSSYILKDRVYIPDRSQYATQETKLHFSDTLLQFLSDNSVETKRNIVKLLPRFSKHIDRFQSEAVTKEWVQLSLDKDSETRKTLGAVVRQTIENSHDKISDPKMRCQLLKIVFDPLFENLNNILTKSEDLTFEEDFLEFLKELGHINDEYALKNAYKILIVFIMISRTYLNLRAFDIIRQIAVAQNITPNKLYTRYKTQYCECIAFAVIYNYTVYKKSLMKSLNQLVFAFDYTVSDFLSCEGHHLIPYLIESFITLPDSRPLLNDIASVLICEPPEVLNNYFGNIYVHVYLNANEHFKSCMQYIASCTGCNISTLKRIHSQRIYNELITNFHDKRELVLKGIFDVAKDSSESNVLSDSATLQEVADVLNPRFLGFLVYFDGKLLSKKVCEEVKLNVLLSLSDLLRLMGTKYITPLRFKVLAILRTSLTLTEQKYVKPTIDAWDAFVHCCDPESLAPLLSTIFISLLHLLTKFPQEIEFIFRYLLIENQAKVQKHIADLFFLQDTNINKEFKAVVEKNTALYQSFSLLEQIDVYLKFLSHENHEVRVYALKFLKRLLADKRLELNEIILGSNGLNVLLVDLIDTLMAGCRENDEKIRLACGEVLGELGAIEPSHFPRKYSQAGSQFTFYITYDSFVVNALLELIRCFQSEQHTQNMNRHALAIQEILKVYEVSPDENALNHDIWKNFPDNIKELMLPLLSSRYTIADTSDKIITCHPIYGSNLVSSFRDWLYKWTCYLISIVKNSKKPLLQVCLPSLRQDYKTLMFFLPHILVHAITECSFVERDIVYKEFNAVLTSSNQKQRLDKVLAEFRPIYVKHDHHLEENPQGSYMNIIFILLDYLDRWLLEFESRIDPRNPVTAPNAHYKTIFEFTLLFCKLKLAQCNYERKEYPRALIYLEKYVTEDKSRLKDQLEFFVNIYAKLEEPDGVAGAMALQRTEPTLQNKIVAHRVMGQFQDMALCYDRMAQVQNLTPECLQDMVKCYLELDNPYTASNIAQGAVLERCDYKSWLCEQQAECYWRLNSYEKLSELLSQPDMADNNSWGVSIGRTLQHFRLRNRIEFRTEIKNITRCLTDHLAVTSIEEGMYRHGYSNIICLHILNELEKAEELLHEIINCQDAFNCQRSIDKLIEEWDLRLKTLQPAVHVLEPVLRLRRIILEQSQTLLKSDHCKDVLNKHIAKYWLKSAEIARLAGIFQQAYSYILKAESYKPKELFIEKAQHYWAREDTEQAFSTLKRGIEEHFPDVATFKDMNPVIRKEDRKLCAEAKLLIATYNDETSDVAMEANSLNFKESVEIYKEWENSLVSLAQCYDKMISNMEDNERDIQGAEIQIHIIHCFGKSLQYGSSFLHQSMPRMLSIWLDYGTRIAETNATDSAQAKGVKKKTLVTMIDLMDKFLDRLPSYMFLSAFSQLVSRICHPVREVYLHIKSIFIKLIFKYPQQSMWMLLAISKSTYAMRTKRCQEVLQDQRLKNSNVMKLIYDFNRLAEKLIELCNKNISDGISVTSVNAILRQLPRLLKTPDFSQIILPIQKLLKLVLPNPDFTSAEHNPFPNKYIYIVDIEDEVYILPSLQKPKKITFRASDGKKYIHMLKPKDDLRKDCRLMEFNAVVNWYLLREPESRHRRLYLRTYSVLPLNEECGIIEWVNNLIGFRQVIIRIYKQRGIFMDNRELKTLICANKDSLAKKRNIFERDLLARHPAVLSEWFRRKFSDAHHWYQARTAYIRTCAAMSMVGYILGLGDRHGENILLDSTNGDVVHVDFNCLFNKGETFECPELVPFRLTHNMVEAMGPFGVEGVFRRSCAVTLRVLRTHTDTLLSILRPFVYDPLVSWPRYSFTAEAERTNEQAFDHIKNIELRLQGFYRGRGKVYQVPLSCEGQANNLITEATDIDNLAQMYIGWGAYL